MTKISIITQNFSSTGNYNDTPLMLLPQAPTSTTTTSVSDRDQEGFNQLLLHDRNRQRQSYVQSYTAFETLRKRQDFVVRQESLRSLQGIVERMATKQDQNIDQSFHSYKQCFGKFINIKSSTHRNLQEQQKRPKTAGPSFNHAQMHQHSPISMTPFDSPTTMSSHRYQKSCRPSTSTRYRSNASSFRTAKIRQDPFRTTSFISHSQPFFSFTENYFQKQDRSASKSPIPTNNSIDRKPNVSPMAQNVIRRGSKSPIARHEITNHLLNQFQIATNEHTDRSRNNSLIIKDHVEDHLLDEVSETTNHDDYHQPLTTFQESTKPANDIQVIINEVIDRPPSRSQISTSYVSDQLKNKPQFTTTNLTSRPSSRSQMSTSNVSDESENKPQFTTNNPPNRPTSGSQIETNNLLSQPQSQSQMSTSTATDRPTTGLQLKPNHDEINPIVEYMRPVSAKVNLPTKSKSKHSNKHSTRPTASSRITNTPSTSPQMDYLDAIQDGLAIKKDKEDEETHSGITSVVSDQRRSSQQSATQTSNNNNSSTATQKRPKTGKKKHTIFVDLTSRTRVEPATEADDTNSLEKAIIIQNYASNPIESTSSSKIKRRKVPSDTTTPQVKKPSSAKRPASVRFKDDVETRSIISVASEQQGQPQIENKAVEVSTPLMNIIPEPIPPPIEELLPPPPETILKRVKKGAFDSDDIVIPSTIRTLGSHRASIKKSTLLPEKETKKKSTQDEIETKADHQATLDLIQKIQDITVGISIGKLSISKQGCRFELPFDLKILENLTPLDYISNYCRLSKHRNYQFKRIFEKYRNGQYRLDINNLYTAIVDIHTDNFTQSQYEYLCQLIDIQTGQHQFTFSAFAGILAVCERIIYDSVNSSSDPEDFDLAKDPLEKCDFDALDRKLNGFTISETMKKLLKTL